MVVGRSGEHRLNDIVLTSCETLDTLAASALCLILRHRNTLDISEISESKYAGFLGNKILDINLAGNVHYRRAAVVAVFVGNFHRLRLNKSEELMLVTEKLEEFGNLCLELGKLVLNLDSFEAGQLTETHLNYRLCLNIIKAEAGHESFFTFVDAL